MSIREDAPRAKCPKGKRINNHLGEDSIIGAASGRRRTVLSSGRLDPRGDRIARIFSLLSVTVMDRRGTMSMGTGRDRH